MGIRLLCVLITSCCISSAFSAYANQDNICVLCGRNSESCWVDNIGAVYCQKTLISYPDECTNGLYIVDSRAIMIGEEAFYGNRQIQQVIISEGVIMLGEGCFSTSNIESVSLPGSLLVIADNAFAMCNRLDEVEIPGHVYAIGRGAFIECSAIKSISIPKSTRFIGTEAFAKTGIRNLYFEGVLCSVERGFISRTASSAGPLTIHFVEWAENDEIGDVPNIIRLFSNKPDVDFAFDIKDGF